MTDSVVGFKLPNLPPATEESVTMHATRRVARQQQKRLKSYCANSDSYQFFKVLTSEALLEKVEQLLPAHRERLYPPTETLSMFLAQAMSADRSCQQIVDQAAVLRL